MLKDRFTGEIVDSQDTGRIRESIDRLLAEKHKHYRALDDLQETLNLFQAELPPAEFPPPSRRTARQEKVARCPNCGLRYGLTREGVAGKMGETTEGAT